MGNAHSLYSQYIDYSPNTTLFAATKPSHSPSEEIPNVLFASDGRKFFPCKHCCRAFAYRSGLMSHVKSCSFRVVDVSDSDEDDKPDVKRERTPIEVAIVKPETAKSEVSEAASLCDVQILINSNVRRSERKQIEVWENLVLQRSSPAEETNNNLLVEFTKPAKRRKTAKKKSSKRPDKVVVEVNKKATCGLCSQDFATALELLRHKRESHVDRKVKLSVESLKIYDKIYQSSNKSTCPICGKSVKKSTWQRHLQTHGTVLNYFCSVCKKGFHRIDHQREHEKRHIVKA